MMRPMKTDDIAHLARLARIELSEDEQAQLSEELSTIVEYVSVVGEIAGDEAAAVPSVGAHFNVFRTDEVRNEPDQHTADILREMPATKGRYLQVKKILNPDD